MASNKIKPPTTITSDKDENRKLTKSWRESAEDIMKQLITDDRADEDESDKETRRTLEIPP